MRRVGRFLWLAVALAVWSAGAHADELGATNATAEPATNMVSESATNTTPEASSTLLTNAPTETPTNETPQSATNTLTEPLTNTVVVPSTNVPPQTATNEVVAPPSPTVVSSATNAVTNTVVSTPAVTETNAVTAEPGSSERGITPIPTINFDRMTFDNVANMSVFEGHVVARDKDATLVADRIRFNKQTSEAWAEGHVRLNQGAQEWVAPSLYYNFATKRVKADEARGFIDPLYLHVHNLEQVGTNHYVFASSTVTTSDLDHPGYTLQANHGEVWSGDRLVLHGVTVHAGTTPVLWSPIVIWSLKGDMPPAVVTMGDNSLWGPFLLSSFTWKANRSVDVTVHADERLERGFGTGADAQYRVGKTGHGLLTGYYISDSAPDKSEPGGGFVSHGVTSGPASGYVTNSADRYRVEWQHKQYLTNDVTLTVDLNKMSDAEMIHDYFRHDFDRNREPDSVADITRAGPDYTLSFLARPQFNEFFSEVERLPEAKLAVNRTRLGQTPLFYEGESSVGQYNNHAGDTNIVGTGESPDFEGNAVRADTFHQIVVPSMLGGWLSVVPHAGVRGDYYSRAPGDAPETQNVTRVIYDLGEETSFKISREWDDVHNNWLQIDGLRHILQPFAEYQWVPRPDRSTNDLFQFDSVRDVTLLGGDSLSVTRYSPLAFPANDQIDSITKEDTVRFGLRQTLQTRRDDQAWNLVDLTGWTDYEVEKSPGQSDFSDFFGTAEIRPYRWLTLDTFGRYQLNGGIMREFNTALRIVDADRWTVGLGTRYLRGDSNLVSVDWAYKLSRHWTAHVYERVDMQDGLWQEQEYTLRQETHDWYITYGFRYLENEDVAGQARTPNEMTAFFSVTLKAYPQAVVQVN
ncbi:MAG TPA: LPS assembly protein LptD [Verrucomicrobiae bacterium]|nr:LPS assembly protein LptD [Verrucomicrobiae bacterium]